MKKTITALLALAGLATAGTTVKVDLDTTKTEAIIATSELTLDNLTNVISSTTLRSSLLGLTVVRDADTDSETSYPWSISANYWAPSNELHIYGVEAGNAVSGYASASFSDSANPSSWPTGHKLSNAFSLEGAVKGAITLGYAGDHAVMTNENGETESATVTGTAVVLSVLYNDGTIKSIYGLASGQKYSNDGIAYLTYNSDVLAAPSITTGTNWTRDSLIAANEAVFAAAPAVPEPATATLSLLALAGLAARRRRK